MTNKESTKDPIGPQGTQMFAKDSINELIAKEIMHSQSANATTPALIGVSHQVTGQKFILSKNKLEVGRRVNSDIRIDDSGVSAMHAHIILEGNDWKVLNLLSSNGTFVNGEKVSEKYLQSGDRIGFAGAEFVFTFIDEPKPVSSVSKKQSTMLVAIALILAFAGLLYFIV